jgi:hypothetical protein
MHGQFKMGFGGTLEIKVRTKTWCVWYVYQERIEFNICSKNGGYFILKPWVRDFVYQRDVSLDTQWEFEHLWTIVRKVELYR